MKVVAKPSFIYFVYPFLFETETFEHRASAIQFAQWQGREGMLKVWKEREFPKDGLLAHVERYLSPPEGAPPTAYLWQIEHAPLHSPAGFGADAEWTLIIPGKEIPFHWGDMRLDGMQLKGVQFALFLHGVGFLTIGVKVKSDDIADWLDFLHYFRFVRGQRGVSVRAQRRIARDQFEPFFPEPAGGKEKHPDGKGVFGEILDAILKIGATGEEPNWWREVFVPGQLIPYAVLYVDDEGINDRQIGELLYRVRNFFPSEREICPNEEELCFDHPSLLCYADRMWFIFSLEGGAFVAVNAPRTDFFRNQLPSHLHDQYFLLFLLALHQRFTLMSLSHAVSEHWMRSEGRAQAFERIHDTLLNFTAKEEGLPLWVALLLSAVGFVLGGLVWRLLSRHSS